MRLRKTVLFLSLCLIFFACGRRSGVKDQESVSFHISGKIQNNTSEKIFLSSLIGQQFVVFDSTKIQPDGSFQFEGKMTGPEVYRISLSPADTLLVVVDTQYMEFQADANDLQQSFSVSSSDESESIRMKELMQTLREHRKEATLVEKGFMGARQTGNADSILHYQEKFLYLKPKYKNEIRNFIRENPDSFVASYAAYSLLNAEEETGFLDSILRVFNKSIPDTRYVNLLTERLQNLYRPDVGSIAPDITLPQPDGSPLTLSSLRGEYVLIDFWASWCRPCRQENPNVVKLYNRYKNNGFEILGISLDESKDQWLEAIDKDRLPWRHVSDLKGAGSVATRIYKVQAIPMTLLLDKEGRILALNLRGSSLENKLAELFSGK